METLIGISTVRTTITLGLSDSLVEDKEAVSRSGRSNLIVLVVSSYILLAQAKTLSILETILGM